VIGARDIPNDDIEVWMNDVDGTGPSDERGDVVSQRESL